MPMGASDDVGHHNQKCSPGTKTQEPTRKDPSSLSGKKLDFLSIMINQCHHMTANDKPPDIISAYEERFAT